MTKSTDVFTQFRDKLYSCFSQCADALFDLLDALIQSEYVEFPRGVEPVT
jgi:hypothetical protein